MGSKDNIVEVGGGLNKADNKILCEDIRINWNIKLTLERDACLVI